MVNLNEDKFFKKLLKKFQINGLLYKNFIIFLKSFYILFLIKKKYNFKMININYLLSIDYDLQINLPIFTKTKRKKKLTIISLSIKKKMRELLKWSNLLIKKYKFRSVILRILFYFLDISISTKYNALSVIKINILKSMYRKKYFKKKKKIPLKYLGELKLLNAKLAYNVNIIYNHCYLGYIIY